MGEYFFLLGRVSRLNLGNFAKAKYSDAKTNGTVSCNKQQYQAPGGWDLKSK